jgi:tRNA threonylcarbamoyladenosine biosynthesis protein TsaB
MINRTTKRFSRGRIIKQEIMTKILSIETATDVCSVAILEDKRLVAQQELYVPRSHASRLAVMIDDMLKKSGVQANELDAVAVSKGPGSYTGLRIGVSTAKGFCYSLDLPLIAVNTLSSMVKRAIKSSPGFNYYIPMLDARRMEVYTMVSDSDGEEVEVTHAAILNEASFRSVLNKGRCLFIGDGAKKASMLIKHPNATFQPSLVPGARETGERAFELYKEGKFEDVEKFEPFYLKDFVATMPKAG